MTDPLDRDMERAQAQYDNQTPEDFEEQPEVEERDPDSERDERMGR